MGWRYLVFTVASITLGVFIIRFFIFPFHESPKFLLAKGNDRAAVEVVHKIAAFNRRSCDLTVVPLLTICCALRYIEDLQLRITSVERLIQLVSQGYQSPPQHTVADLSQYAPGQDLGDLLSGGPGGSNLSPPAPSNPILPSRFLLPSGERVDTRPSQGVKDAEVYPIADTAQRERGEYHGSASVYGLVESALEFRDGAKCRSMTFEERFPNRRREFWEVQYVSLPSVLYHP